MKSVERVESRWTGKHTTAGLSDDGLVRANGDLGGTGDLALDDDNGGIVSGDGSLELVEGGDGDGLASSASGCAVGVSKGDGKL
jgi:hypothetical protein